MSTKTSTKTPLHSVVAVICDSLVELPAEDQLRALEAARVSLGLRAPRSAPDRNPYRDVIDREPLPVVEVQMLNDRPVVLAGNVMLAGNAREFMPGSRRLQQLPAPATLPTRVVSSPSSGGYVRPRR